PKLTKLQILFKSLKTKLWTSAAGSTRRAHTLDENVNLFHTVVARQSNLRNLYVKTVCLAATYALKMQVVVVVFRDRAVANTQCVLQPSRIIQYLVNESTVKKSFQCAIHRDSVQRIRNLVFNVCMRECMILSEKKVKDRLPVGR